MWPGTKGNWSHQCKRGFQKNQTFDGPEHHCVAGHGTGKSEVTELGWKRNVREKEQAELFMFSTSNTHSSVITAHWGDPASLKQISLCLGEHYCSWHKVPWVDIFIGGQGPMACQIGWIISFKLLTEWISGRYAKMRWNTNREILQWGLHQWHAVKADYRNSWKKTLEGDRI